MNEKRRPWIQAAVDVTDIGLGKEIARMAADAGAEWIEVGTPLLCHYGFEAIRELKKTVGDRARLIADFKYFHGPTLIEPAAQAGADYILMEDIFQDRFVEEALALARENNVELVYSLISKKPEDYVPRGLELASMGVNYLFMWRTVTYKGQIWETLKKMRAATDIYIGVSDDDLSSARAAVDEGADWITFGTVLKQNNPEVCREWVDTILSRQEL